MTRRTVLKGFLGLFAGALAPKFGHSKPVEDADFVLENQHIKARWQSAGGKLVPVNNSDIFVSPACQLLLEGGRLLSTTNMALQGVPQQQSGSLAARFVSDEVVIDWVATLQSEAHYIQQQVKIIARGKALPIRKVILHDVDAGDLRTTGSVRGCPLANDTSFYGFEHPLSEHEVSVGRAIAYLPRELPLQPKQSVTYSSVIGMTAEGQLRRDFQAYLEAARAHPYRPFLHYNSWYDLCFSDIRFTAAQAIERIKTFGKKLFTERGVKLKSYLMDDGWDDPKTLWGFNEGFPEGFTPVTAAAKEHGAAPGVWMSPWGGYGNEKVARMEFGAKQGFEQNKDGFALSGPKYFKRFRDTCLKMIRDYGVNQFKLDGMGNINSAIKGSAFDSDFDAAIQLIKDIRSEKSDIYINLTYGTFPSPFWLWHADSIWRGGKDHDHAGAGTKRQQWITYRDADTYENVVKKSELFPLNSLMLHGVIFAQHTKHLKADPFGDFDDEVRSFFCTGTQCQELYITPDLLNDHHWDQLAEAAKFADQHQAILRDVHWIGGNPNKAEIYGWAAWSKDLSIITLRNPSADAQSFEVDVSAMLELPNDAGDAYEAHSVWDNNRPPINLFAGEKTAVELKPFELVTLLCKEIHTN